MAAASYGILSATKGIQEVKALATSFAIFACAVAFADGSSGSLTVGCPVSGIDEFRTIAKFAKSIGATHVDASQIEHSLWQWDMNRKDPAKMERFIDAVRNRE